MKLPFWIYGCFIMAKRGAKKQYKVNKICLYVSNLHKKVIKKRKIEEIVKVLYG